VSNFSIAHTVRNIRQPSTYACWAAASAMAVGQLGGRPATVARVQQAARRAGVRLERNGSLPSGNPTNMTTLAGAVGMQVLSTRGMVFNIARLLQRLRPAPVVLFGGFVYQGRTRRLTNHALVITGLFGDGTNTGTALTLVDPFDGRDYNFGWQQFATRVVARLDYIFYRARRSR